MSTHQTYLINSNLSDSLIKRFNKNAEKNISAFLFIR